MHFQSPGSTEDVQSGLPKSEPDEPFITLCILHGFQPRHLVLVSAVGGNSIFVKNHRDYHGIHAVNMYMYKL